MIHSANEYIHSAQEPGRKNKFAIKKLEYKYASPLKPVLTY